MIMKITSLLATILFTQINLFANDSVLVRTIQDNESINVSMDLEIDGTIKLYSVLNDKTEVQTETYEAVEAEAFTNWVLHPDKDFYIGIGSEAEAITPSNYKRLAKKYFETTPELTERIGKRGFRYKNLPSMILYYNKMTDKKGGLTKDDIIAYH